MKREVVGPAARPRMRRWRLATVRGAVACVHQFLRADPPGLHDHHAWNVTVVLRGTLIEEREGGRTVTLGAGAIVFRRSTTLHRLTPIGTAWTLFFIGCPRRKWGYVRDGVWVPHDRA